MLRPFAWIQPPHRTRRIRDVKFASPAHCDTESGAQSATRVPFDLPGAWVDPEDGFDICNVNESVVVQRDAEHDPILRAGDHDFLPAGAWVNPYDCQGAGVRYQDGSITVDRDSVRPLEQATLIMDLRTGHGIDYQHGAFRIGDQYDSGLEVGQGLEFRNAPNPIGRRVFFEQPLSRSAGRQDEKAA